MSNSHDKPGPGKVLSARGMDELENKRISGNTQAELHKDCIASEVYNMMVHLSTRVSLVTCNQGNPLGCLWKANVM